MSRPPASRPLYRLRLWAAKRRRHLNHWTLRLLSSWLERLTKRQLSLLTKAGRLASRLADPEELDSQSLLSTQEELASLMLRFPLGMSSRSDQETLEELQLLCRELTTRLRSRG